MEIAPMGLQAGISKLISPSADRAGAFQQRLEGGCKDDVAAINGILGIPQQMREAILVPFGVSALRCEAVGDPHRRPRAGEKVRHHRFAATGHDDVGGGGGASKHPLPVGFAFDAG